MARSRIDATSVRAAPDGDRTTRYQGISSPFAWNQRPLREASSSSIREMHPGRRALRGLLPWPPVISGADEAGWSTTTWIPRGAQLVCEVGRRHVQGRLRHPVAVHPAGRAIADRAGLARDEADPRARVPRRGSSAVVTRRGPRVFTSNGSRSESTSSGSIEPHPPMPALLTSTSSDTPSPRAASSASPTSSRVTSMPSTTRQPISWLGELVRQVAITVSPLVWELPGELEPDPFAPVTSHVAASCLPLPESSEAHANARVLRVGGVWPLQDDAA